MSEINTADEARAFLDKYVAEMPGCTWREGEIGFGRECVGILYGSNYLEYPLGDEVKNVRRVPTPHAYANGPYLAIEARGDDAVIELARWAQAFRDAGFTRVAKEEDLAYKMNSPQGRAMMEILGNRYTYMLAKGEATA